jgi:hypothetical protein
MEDSDRQPAPDGKHSATVSSRGWFALLTGLNVAFFVAYMMCKPSANHTLYWAPPTRLCLSLRPPRRR